MKTRLKNIALFFLAAITSILYLIALPVWGIYQIGKISFEKLRS